MLARDTLYQAGKKYEGDLQGAKELYEQSFEVWRKVLDKSPVLRDSQIMADELNDDIDKYKKLLGQIGAKLPEPFILQDMVDLHEGKRPSGEELERRKLHDSAEPDAERNRTKTARSIAATNINHSIIAHNPWIMTVFISVISSTTYFGPSFPSPLSFNPP